LVLVAQEAAAALLVLVRTGHQESTVGNHCSGWRLRLLLGPVAEAVVQPGRTRTVPEAEEGRFVLPLWAHRVVHPRLVLPTLLLGKHREAALA